MMTQETLKRTLGERLEKARKVNGWDQTDLAQRLGISRRSVTRYETDLKVPSLAVLIAWAKVCDVPYSWLIDETFPGPDIQGKQWLLDLFDENTLLAAPEAWQPIPAAA